MSRYSLALFIPTPTDLSYHVETSNRQRCAWWRSVCTPAWYTPDELRAHLAYQLGRNFDHRPLLVCPMVGSPYTGFPYDLFDGHLLLVGGKLYTQEGDGIEEAVEQYFHRLTGLPYTELPPMRGYVAHVLTR